MLLNTKNFIIILNSTYYNLTKEYINLFFDNINLKIIKYNKSDGTYNTIKNSLSSHYNSVELLITWCDVYPISKIDFNKLSKKRITIFTNGSESRFKYKNGNLYRTHNGDVIGIYYIPYYTKLQKKDYNDIADYFMEEFNNLDKYELESIIDYGDPIKYLKVNKNKNTIMCRYFNEVEIKDNKFIKRSVTKYGQKIFERECMWYRFHNNILDIIKYPEIYSIEPTQITMEYKKDYEPLYKIFFKLSNAKKETLVKDIYNILCKLHNSKRIPITIQLFKKDLLYEIDQKITERINKIKGILKHFSYIKRVNGVKIHSIEKILDRCKRVIYNYYDNKRIEYSPIHGDCQFSNILYNLKKDKLSFIDVRGYFGHTDLYGLPDYDISKLLYALSGYDIFNTTSDNITIQDDNIQIETESYIINTNIFNRVHYAFLPIIWISLAEYNKNNILKCIGSYYYGLYLGSIFFDKIYLKSREIEYKEL